jgi:hypothetical protein
MSAARGLMDGESMYIAITPDDFGGGLPDQDTSNRRTAR